MSDNKCSCGENEACSNCNSQKRDQSNSSYYSNGYQLYNESKKLVVTYVEVDGISDNDVESYVDRIQKKLRLDDTNTIQWFIPVRNEGTRVEVFHI